jgi:c-di-GMP-related signal transduction protein
MGEESLDIYLARQPIFDKKQRICGYELLFRDGPSNAFPDVDGDTATSKLLTNSFFRMGIDQVSQGKKAFINFTQELLVKKVPTLFPPQSLVVEVLEDVRPDRELLLACKEIAEKGYVLALDDFFMRPELKPLVLLAKLVKIDFRASPVEGIERCVRDLAVFPVRLLAEKVETREEFTRAVGMGFEYFQGYFFSKPEILKERDISPSKMALLQIVAEANKEDFSFEALEKMIARDVSISYKILRYMNSSFFKRVNEISSLKQAIVLLGEQGIRRFMSLIVMSRLAEDKPDVLVRTSIIRARFCELLGKGSRRKVDESELFTLGLFSLIDAILDDSMDRLMKKLPLSEEIKKALVEGSGNLIDFLKLSWAYEKGDWTGVAHAASRIEVEEEKMPAFYMDAIGWADSLASA